MGNIHICNISVLSNKGPFELYDSFTICFVPEYHNMIDDNLMTDIQSKSNNI